MSNKREEALRPIVISTNEVEDPKQFPSILDINYASVGFDMRFFSGLRGNLISSSHDSDSDGIAVRSDKANSCSLIALKVRFRLSVVALVFVNFSWKGGKFGCDVTERYNSLVFWDWFWKFSS